MFDNLTIYKQIYPNQCAKIFNLGYRSLINIRPDNEIAGQPTHKQLQRSAIESQLRYVYLPFENKRLSHKTVAEFAKQYHQLPKPILMFCGSGARAKLLYQSALMQGLL